MLARSSERRPSCKENPFVSHYSIPVELLAPLVDASRIEPTFTTDVVVVGAGVAGLAFALTVPESIQVMLLTKGRLGESNTRWAQGGLSAAIGSDDNPGLHEVDTLYAGAGLSDPETVHDLVNAGPDAVDWLLSLGAAFDRDPDTGELALGREAAHSRRRVLHAGGDATGAEIERALVAAVRSRTNVTICEFGYAVDLLVEDGSCIGAVLELAGVGLCRVRAEAVVLAAGGAGQLWATTSNPPAATADGIAIALRAGAAVADLEFCQFHPTVLHLPGETPFLVSEAVRGEGAYLRGKDGERFMVAKHEMAELAPRDVVARGNLEQMIADGSDHVYLDLRHLDREDVRARFPSIAAELDKRGLDLGTDLIPVAPAAHYFMGGVVADEHGKTTLPGLLAVGEAACTGVHGANRLASNSLLEGLVFGRMAAQALNLVSGNGEAPLLQAVETGAVPVVRVPETAAAIQSIMSRYVSVVRDGTGLETAIDELSELPPGGTGDRGGWTYRNMLTVGIAISIAALTREESRGSHYRSDFPQLNPDLDGTHLVLNGSDDGRQSWTVGPLWPVGVAS
jgi:L-aspartate oxidase